jgi:hypothetical protein
LILGRGNCIVSLGFQPSLYEKSPRADNTLLGRPIEGPGTKFIRENNHMTQRQVTRITWNRAIVLVTSVFLVSAVVTLLLQSHSLYLVPPLTKGTLIFYLTLVLAPAVLTLIWCARRHPSGFRITGILLPVWMVALFCLYLILAGPTLFRYSTIDCHSVTRSGLLIQYACTCRRVTPEGAAAHGIQANCSLDGFAFSPLLPVTERGIWQAIP